MAVAGRGLIGAPVKDQRVFDVALSEFEPAFAHFEICIPLVVRAGLARLERSQFRSNRIKAFQPRFEFDVKLLHGDVRFKGRSPTARR